jgi:hypothetical protein
LSNGVPISAFTGQPKDEELLYMVTFLEELYAKIDVRPQIESTFKLTELLKKHGRVVERKISNQANLMQNAIANQNMNNAGDFMKRE